MILEPGRCHCSTYFILVLRYSISVTVGVVLHCPRVSYLPANRLDAPPDGTHETPSACLLQGFICLANVGLPLPRALETTSNSPFDNGVDEGTVNVAGTCAVRYQDLLEIQAYWQWNDQT